MEHLDTEEVVDKLPTDQLAPPVPEVVRWALKYVALSCCFAGGGQVRAEVPLLRCLGC